MPKTGNVLLQWWAGGIQWKGHYLVADQGKYSLGY
jgi:hypothetical protein